MTAAVVSGLFIVALFFLPRSFVGSGYRYSRGIGDRGSFMFDAVKKIRFDDMTEAFPAFCDYYYDAVDLLIAEGIVLGLLTYVLLKLFAG